jgi:hypothetical protein
MNHKITAIIDQATKNLRVKQIYDQAGTTWDMQWNKLAERAEGKGISVVPYIVTGSGQYLMPEFNRYEFARLIIEECARICDVVRENNGGDKQFGARLCADEIRYLNRRS